MCDSPLQHHSALPSDSTTIVQPYRLYYNATMLLYLGPAPRNAKLSAVSAAVVAATPLPPPMFLHKRTQPSTPSTTCRSGSPENKSLCVKQVGAETAVGIYSNAAHSRSGCAPLTELYKSKNQKLKTEKMARRVAGDRGFAIPLPLNTKEAFE